MPLIQRLSTALAHSRFFRRRRAVESVDEEPGSPQIDPAEEFQKLHRGLRRLSLASDRGEQALQAVGGRLDELQQALIAMSRPRETALSLGETQLLRLLDELERAASVPELPAAARSPIESVTRALLDAARWRPIAVIGASPDGTDIRIADCLGDAANGRDGVRIHRVLEQGYRRADGSLLRPGVVVAAVATGAADTQILIHHSAEEAFDDDERLGHRSRYDE